MDISQEGSNVHEAEDFFSTKRREIVTVGGNVRLSGMYSEMAVVIMAVQKRSQEELLKVALKEYIKTVVANPELLYSDFREIKKALDQEDIDDDRTGIIDP